MLLDYNWTIGKHYSTTYTDLNNKNDWNNHDKGCDVSELKRILQQITALSDVPDPAVLKRLIDELRVSDKEPALANEKIQSLIDIIHQHPEYGDGLSSFVLKLIIQYRQIALYTDTGIMSDQGFFNSLRRLIGHRFLPLLPQEDSVVELVGYLFNKRSDERVTMRVVSVLKLFYIMPRQGSATIKSFRIKQDGRTNAKKPGFITDPENHPKPVKEEDSEQ